MTFEEYQKRSRETAIYPEIEHVGNVFAYLALGLTGESGEVADKIKKMLRDRQGMMDEEERESLIKELGDVLWYLAQFATELGTSFDEIALMNLEKLQSRKQREMIKGEGDGR